MQIRWLAVQLALWCAGLPQVVPAATPTTLLTQATVLGATDCAAVGSALTTKTVLVPAGKYRPFFKNSLDGNDGKQALAPQIEVPAFRLDAAAVTRGEYLRFVCQHPAWRRSNVKAIFAEETYLTGWSNDLDLGTQPQDQPVTHVSWFAARAFCAARNARLPTLAEWERAGGDAGAVAAAQRDETSAAGNPFRFAMGRPATDLRHSGLTFAGVWEWTADFNSVAAGNAGGSGSLFCGDGFRSNDARDYAAFLRYSFRSSLRGNYSLKNLGFRCAEDVRP